MRAAHQGAERGGIELRFRREFARGSAGIHARSIEARKQGSKEARKQRINKRRLRGLEVKSLGSSAGADSTELTILAGSLVLAEALELVHGAFHILARGVGGGADALNAEVEIVRVRGAQQGFFERDEIARIEIEERLIECLHAVLAGAGGDGIADHARLVRIDDAVANIAGHDHDFDGRHAARAVTAADEALADDGLERRSQLQTNLLLLGRREDSDDALNRLRSG